MQTLHINIREFLKYKFLNSLFLGISVGSIFTLYAPIEPSVYSLGGIALAFAMLGIANLYSKILNIHSFYKISVFVELVTLAMVGYFLLFSYNYMSALVMYGGYQLTFAFGSYLIRAETLFLKKTLYLEKVDVAKQAGYLFGMLFSYLFYKFLEHFLEIFEKQEQVYTLHFLLLGIEIIIIFYLVKAFKGNK
ncbi:MAG: hypothetical protein AUK54_03270 [Helicobacteraceae bacterium CG2_30_36_10]|nr:MAG: hypothetical protein AUK54_03270 [Helicobacteraceae bacterium CG2_30_36_10]